MLNKLSVQKEGSPATPIHVSIPAVEHPFLLVRKQDYTGLQARAQRSPWKEQKTAAIQLTSTLVCHPSDGIRAWAETLARIFSTTALADILDPQQRRKYRDRIIEHLKMFDGNDPGSMTAQMRANPDKGLWIYSVPTGNAFVQGVLALDIIHDDLPADQLLEIEHMLRTGAADYFLNTKMAWRQGAYAAQAIWPLYEGDASVYEPLIEEWVGHTLGAISQDGVFYGGTGYSCARWTQADREHKALFGEVLAHLGILSDWYQEPRLQKFQEWINGYAYSPFRIYWAFGDSGPSTFDSQLQPGPERAYRYSKLASGYAAWLAAGNVPFVGLGSYVLAEQSYPPPIASPSRVFADGGAWLKEASLDPHSLSAGMLNLRSCPDVHAHKETNSICLAAYGEMLLRGAGYNGWNDGEHDFSWAYINDRAISGNTVLFDYAVPASHEEELNPSSTNDHVNKFGAGITFELLTGVIDFARGDSGEAIPNGRHVRNLLFIHSADGVAGYYVVIDELLATRPGGIGHIIWHPGSANYVQTAESQEYTWNVREFSDADVKLTIFLVTPPVRSVIRNGVLANWGKGINAKYLACDYATTGTGSATSMTVLFPHDSTHPKAGLLRLKGDKTSAAIVRQGAVEDHLFESDGDKLLTITQGVTTRARAGIIRKMNSTRVVSVWLMDATLFQSPWFEFRSTAPVILLRAGNSVHVTTKVECDITFVQSGLVEITGGQTTPSPIDNIGPNPIRILVGSHTLNFFTTQNK